MQPARRADGCRTVVCRCGDAPLWELTASYGRSYADLHFTNDLQLQEQMTIISVARRVGSAWTVYGAAGAILGGQIEDPTGRHDVGAGWMLSLGGSRLVFPQASRGRRSVNAASRLALASPSAGRPCPPAL